MTVVEDGFVRAGSLAEVPEGGLRCFDLPWGRVAVARIDGRALGLRRVRMKGGEAAKHEGTKGPNHVAGGRPGQRSTHQAQVNPGHQAN